jgi:hypothetical protein
MKSIAVSVSIFLISVKPFDDESHAENSLIRLKVKDSDIKPNNKK